VRVVRLGTDAYPIWDGSGAAVRGGRWNPTGFPVIYAASSLSLAMLEFLAQGKDFDRTFLVDADIPDNIAIDDLMHSRHRTGVSSTARLRCGPVAIGLRREVRRCCASHPRWCLANQTT
jgi:RES domain-containing protein